MNWNNQLNPNMVQGMSNINNGVRISKFILIPTNNNYKDVYRRSYNLNVDYNTINTLENIFDEQNVHANSTISDSAIAQGIPNIMSYSNNVNGVAGIANGWSEKRFRFILIAETVLNNMTTLSYIQGYTEYYDVSVSGMLDPRMKYYINSITNVTKLVDVMTGNLVVRPLSTFNVITNQDGLQQYQETDAYGNPILGLPMSLVRPRDVLNNNMHETMYGDGVNLNNLSNSYGAGETYTSSRLNNNPINHFTKTINSFIQGKSDSDISYDTKDSLKSAAGNATESNILMTPFIAALISNNPNSDKASFTEDELRLIDPNVEAIIPDINSSLATTLGGTFIDSNITEDLYKQNIETITAVTIGESINSMLIENMLTKIAFSTTNITGLPVTVISDFNSFIDGVNLISYVNKIKNKIDTILMPEITMNGMIYVDVSVVANILGDTVIDISINNQPRVIYRLPTFADSLFSPVISDTVNSDTLTNDFSTVMDMTYQFDKTEQPY